MIRTDAIDSLSNFQKNAKSFMEQLEDSKEPLILTVNGKAKLVVQDAGAYQAMLDEVEKNRFVEAVRQGIRDANEGRMRPAESVVAELKAKYDLQD